MQEQPLLEGEELDVRGVAGGCVRDSDELLEEDDDEFDHLFVLLVALLLLQAVSQVLHQGLSHVAPYDKVFVHAHLSHQLARLCAVFSRDRRQVDHDHRRQEGQLLVLLVELHQGDQVLLKEAPVAQRKPNEGVGRAVALQVLVDVLE